MRVGVRSVPAGCVLQIGYVSLGVRGIGLDPCDVGANLGYVSLDASDVSANLVKAVLGLGPLLRNIGSERSEVSRESLNGG